MTRNAAVLLLLVTHLVGAASFHVPASHFARTKSALKSSWGEDQQEASSPSVIDKVWNLHQYAPEPTDYDTMLTTSLFPGAISNKDLETRTVHALAERGYFEHNTLLATSLCSDELARKLETDFCELYGPAFNLGGLAGFPFAGNIGFENTALHIPDGGSCLIVYAPHVGVSRTGAVGEVERNGVQQSVETCCTSAIAAANYVFTGEGGANVNDLTDFQQGAVQQLVLPHVERLSQAEYPMAELPRVLFETQDELMHDIIMAGCGGIKNSLALLGGIQINTPPETLDYFVPMRFDLMNERGEVVEDMLYTLLA